MKLLRHLLILLLTIVLPVQGVAGVGMSMCSMDSAPQSALHDAMGAACHRHADESTASGMVSSTLDDDCPHCFALAHFTVAPKWVFLRERLPEGVIVLLDAHFSSHISLPLLRPPLSL